MEKVLYQCNLKRTSFFPTHIEEEKKRINQNITHLPKEGKIKKTKVFSKCENVEHKNLRLL